MNDMTEKDIYYWRHRAEAAEAKYARLVERLRTIPSHKRSYLLEGQIVVGRPVVLMEDVEAAINESEKQK